MSKFKKRNKGSKKPLSDENLNNSGVDSNNKNSQETFESKDDSKMYKRCVVKPGRFNDPSWYYRNEQDLRDNFSISSGPNLGLWINLSDNVFGTPPEYHFMLPGIAIYDITLLPGYSNSSTSALNLASFKIYTRIKRTITSNLPYDPQNVMIYLLAMDSIYALWVHLVRLYKILQTYSSVNRYTPRIMVEAMGFDFDNLIANLSNFRAYLNVLQQKLNSMYVPHILSFFTRHQWLFSNIYKDEDVDRAQLYMLQPAKIYKYIEAASSEEFGILQHVSVQAGVLDQIISFANSLIEPILGSQDMNRIAGDLEKAYGSENAFFLPIVEENMSIEYVADMSVLSQLENADIVAQLGDTDVRESFDGDYLVCMPNYVELTSSLTTPPRWNTKLLNFHLESIEPKFVAEAIRLCCRNSSSSTELSVVGTEVVNAIKLITAVSGHSYTTSTITSNYVFVDENGGGFTRLNSILSGICGFDRFTLLKYCKADSVSTTITNPQFVTYIGDLAHVVPIGYQTLQQMHESALLALFDDDKS